ncbi:hypothetical protein EHI8A_184650 [Entamoeba histolytica HM-1:IMSS-B]|uniref:Deoxynucleoside kinase domain-containing protein n=6 Tax=Entamoeba histolytica TaxID=5759 RepID=C4MBG7_ENTH1|nr:hypothetical protein EHI_034810 [Entamoeba histolytica HM-1:IMSS]EMD47292.1 Hypothetical protein EHI5A_189520 [Entamoeba histolytica KU27]EMH76792.1 hypothetical protein EHI8A_184650 [Entamoeba histolytica HM-1:IMSS-B]EMS15750.1 hypothetical protein KM1_255830 [Entamoeba histolytica HM-3:IMSS]ENY65310.1 hypothetical protein EHI7A_153970 [Entamoeba histolytica HM-1:IMSS-A]GAT99339.1 hypothetical protein CL6EHI_034810 [Entamoeba histolytica]|eukprot:XP_648024.1 hypothetical protein EHI_034810 [Entamoeba histolytica HM-1:IMSS]
MSVLNKPTNYISILATKKKSYFHFRGIGVGKSTLLGNLKSILNDSVRFKIIHEYIDIDYEGEKQLQRLKDGEITNFQFQVYVLHCFETQLDTISYQDAKYVIWERHPIEALKIFCANDNALTQEQRRKLLEIETELCATYGIPKIFDVKSIILKIDTFNYGNKFIAKGFVNQFIQPTIFTDAINHYFIYLYCSNEQEQLRRIITRGRKAELKIYHNIYDLHPVNHAYEDYYDKCIRRKRLLNQGLNI